MLTVDRFEEDKAVIFDDDRQMISFLPMSKRVM